MCEEEGCAIFLWHVVCASVLIKKFNPPISDRFSVPHKNKWAWTNGKIRVTVKTITFYSWIFEVKIKSQGIVLYRRYAADSAAVWSRLPNISVPSCCEVFSNQMIPKISQKMPQTLLKVLQRLKRLDEKLRSKLRLTKINELDKKLILTLIFFSLCYQTATRFVQFIETIPFFDFLSFHP